MISLKKQRTTIALLLSFLFLVACSNAKKTDLQRIDKNGYDLRTTLYYEKDRVVKQKTANTMTYKTLRLNANQAKEVYKEVEREYNSIKGITYKVTFLEDRLIAEMTVDYNKVDVEKIFAITEVARSVEGDHVSYQKYYTNLIKASYKEVKDGKFQELPK